MIFRLERNQRFSKRVALWWHLALEEARRWPRWEPHLQNLFDGAEVILPGDKVLGELQKWCTTIPGFRGADGHGPALLLTPLTPEEERAFLRGRPKHDPLRDYAAYQPPRQKRRSP